KAAIPSPVGVDGASESREDRGPALRLVENRETAGADEVIPFEIEAEALLRLLEVEVAPTKAPGERRLSALAGADQREGGDGAQSPPEDSRHPPLDHAAL